MKMRTSRYLHTTNKETDEKTQKTLVENRAQHKSMGY